MGEGASIRSQYDAADRLFVKDLDKVVDILILIILNTKKMRVRFLLAIRGVSATCSS